MFLRFCIMILKGYVLRYHERLSKACELDVCSGSCTFWVLFYTLILEMQHWLCFCFTTIDLGYELSGHTFLRGS